MPFIYIMSGILLPKTILRPGKMIRLPHEDLYLNEKFNSVLPTMPVAAVASKVAQPLNLLYSIITIGDGQLGRS